MTLIIEYAWVCLYRQNYEYASGPKYAKILNMLKFRIWQDSQYESVTQRSEYAGVTQRSEYARICLDKVLIIMFWIWQGSEYELHRLLNISQYDWICLNLR